MFILFHAPSSPLLVSICLEEIRFCCRDTMPLHDSYGLKLLDLSSLSCLVRCFLTATKAD